MNDPLYIGLDAGGTKTELLAAKRVEDPLAVLTGPAGQVQQRGPEAAARVLAELVREASARCGEPVAALCAGLAGAGRPDDRTAVEHALRRELGPLAPPHLHIVHDGEIALEGAFEGASGLLVLAGTGSLVLVRAADGAVERAGGWGPLIGDEGGGHALGADGLRALAAAFDEGSSTRLRDLFAERHELRTPEALIRTVYAARTPLSTMAPVVLDAAAAGDAEALGILRKQTDDLARQAARLARRCPSASRRIALLGGLSGVPVYAETLREALHRRLPEWTLHDPLHPPVVGAWRLARSLASSTR